MLRLAVVCTPRTGNLWLGTMMGDLWGIPRIALHNPSEVDWLQLPQECLLAIHWHRTPSFLAQLREAGFRVIILARHPLDVLISILQFGMQDRTNLRWLEGENGSEVPIYGAMPGSAAFLEYALSARATSLLDVSQEWWSDPDVFRLRYEELVADTQGELRRLAEWVGAWPRCPFSQVVEKSTLSHMRQRIGEAGDVHIWQGRAGLWKTLLTAPIAERIAQAHPTSFAPLGYLCDPDPSLTPGQADANWIRLSSGVSEKLQQFLRHATAGDGSPAGAGGLSAGGGRACAGSTPTRTPVRS